MSEPLTAVSLERDPDEIKELAEIYRKCDLDLRAWDEPGNDYRLDLSPSEVCLVAIVCDEFPKLLDQARAQSARVAELEKENMRLQDPMVIAESQAEVLAQFTNKLAALESAARWRSCNDEPPEDHAVVLFRRAIHPNQKIAKLIHPWAYFVGFRLRDQWVLVGGGHADPDEWRAIT